ncbi:response regulator [Roseomonas sp. KE0001]|uniref:response regulator n=1 Tax=Roseomonas sp. KE0001 TaxID=2479201 RepID=UPI0018DF511E|nr:response regulator [Roseomonas sp. KE0001]
MQLRRRLPVLACAVALLGLSLSALLMAQWSEQLRDMREAHRRSFRAADVARSLWSDLHDAETSLRGFILTERAGDLGDYEAAMRRIPPRLAELRRMEPLSPRERSLVARLEEWTDLRQDALTHSLAIVRRDGFEAARARMQQDDGREGTQAIQSLIDELLATRRAELERSSALTEAGDRRNLLLGVVAFLMAAAIILGGGLLMMRGNRRLRLAEAALDAKSAVLQSTLESSQEGILAFDAGDALVAWNRRCAELLDLPAGLMRAGTPRAAFEALELGRGAGASGIFLAGEGRAGPLAARRGERILEVYRNPMPERGFVLTCIDVTRREREEERARQVQRMEAIGQLTGGIAHDFNNLLQVISTNLDLLAMQIGGSETARRQLRHARSGTERGAQLTRQLLAFARRQPLAPRVLHLGRLVEETAELLRRTLGERIAVETRVAPDLWTTRIDPAQLENALLNLAINARDAMPEGGRLVLLLANATAEEIRGRERADPPVGDHVLLAVEDNGIGMGPEVLARVFEPFFTTKSEGHGTGLGLPQVYGFVRQSGGHVRIHSAPGHGTAVRLYLPRSLSAADPEAPPEEAAPAPSGQGTILVVEDDAEVREAVVDMLRHLGYRVLKAEDAAAALTVLSSGLHVDLLLTDVIMPGPIRTPELVRRACEMMPRLKVLYTSGYIADALIHDGRLDPGVQLLSKPYRQEDLARHLRRALPGGPSEGPPGEPPKEPSEEPSPRLAAPAGRAGGAAPAGEAGQAEGWPEGEVVLLVEDDPLIRMNLAQMAELFGLVPEEADRGETALAWLRSHPAPAVLVTDLSLPGMSGLALASAARALHPALPVVLASGHAESSIDLPPELRGGLVFLAKPFAMHELEAALREACRKATAMH